jgi:predicted SAM-dependent methyltransferase
MKIIIGARRTSQPGWQGLERGQLDIRDRRQWTRLFPVNSLDAVLSEHVLEHLTFDEAIATASNIFEFLAPGGYWRIAVPDANNPDPIYQDMCRPGGTGRRTYDLWNRLFYGSDEPGHKFHYNLASLSSLLLSEGFQVQPLEFYDDAGRFWRAPWSPEDGWIKRSSESSYLLLDKFVAGCWNTSLIVDAIRPASTLGREFRRTSVGGEVCLWQ